MIDKKYYEHLSAIAAKKDKSDINIASDFIEKSNTNDDYNGDDHKSKDNIKSQSNHAVFRKISGV